MASSEPAVRRLVVVRHAKSAYPAGVPDHQRPLGPRGVRDAPRMGQRIRELVGAVDVAVVSPALRTQQTWALLGAQLEQQPAVLTDPRIYEGWGEQLIEVLGDLPADAGTVLLLGHEPGVSELVLTVAQSTPGELRTRVATKFPTCAFAVLRSERPWSAVRHASAALELFATPKD